MIGQLFYSIVIGAAGNLVLVVFIGGIASMHVVFLLLPWMVGFNAAMTGYMAAERTRLFYEVKSWLGGAAGGTSGLLTSGLIDIIGRRLTGYPLIQPGDHALLVAIGLVCGALGCWLARKYYQIKV